jgi:hypothetical protein
LRKSRAYEQSKRIIFLKDYMNREQNPKDLGTIHQRHKTQTPSKAHK